MDRGSKKLLVLYSSVQGYVWKQLTELVSRFGVEVFLVHWPISKDSPFVFSSQEGITCMASSEFATKKELLNAAKEFGPDGVLISGRMDRDYLHIARHYRKKGYPVLSGIDNQWRNSLRQWLAIGFSWFSYRKYFSHLMPAGFYQWEYARRLGYRRSQLLMHCYSADTELYRKHGQDFLKEKLLAYPRVLLFVGRMVEIKGIDLLWESFLELQEEGFSEWKLLLIGNGALAESVPDHPKILHKEFMMPNDLIKEVSTSGVFCLPSRKEPWGVVVHEFAAAGMPMVLSDEVGAASTFLIEGLNGYSFFSGNKASLKAALKRIMSLSDKELYAMGLESQQLSQRITPTYWAAQVNHLLR